MMSVFRPDSGIVIDSCDPVTMATDMESTDASEHLGSDSVLGLSRTDYTRFSSLDEAKALSTNQISEGNLTLQEAILANDGDDNSLAAVDIAEWALDSQKRNQSANTRNARSNSVQFNYKNIGEGEGKVVRRASAAVLTQRSLSQLEVESGSRPSSGMMSRMKKQSYSNNEGVQLRGDKGKSRRKSNTSQPSKTNQLTAPVSNEWKRSFVIPYTPRSKATKIVRGSIEPPRIKLVTPYMEQDKDYSGTTTKNDVTPICSTHKRKDSLTYSHNGRPSFHTPVKSRHVEIHYENYLPKDLWLEMKPKRFTRNHKHGNHFELRKSDEKHGNTSQSSEGTSKKEAFVWENPYQIWLMEKTSSDS